MSQESLAVLVVGYQNETCYQTLIMPQETDVVLYHREYTGQRGRGSAWREISLGEVPNATHISMPISFSVSSANITQAGIGLITPVSTKAMSLWDSKDGTEFETSADYLTIVKVFRDMVMDGDSDSLQAYVMDNSNVTLKPIRKAQNPVQVVFNPTPAPLVEQPMNNPPTSNDVVIAQVPDKKWAKQYVQRRIHAKNVRSLAKEKR
jgi:hypothetical protein